MYLFNNVNTFFAEFVDIVVVRVVGNRKIKKSDFFWIFIWSLNIKLYNH